MGSISGWGTKIPHALLTAKKKKQGVGPLDRADSLVLTTQEIVLILDCFKCYFKKVDEH